MSQINSKITDDFKVVLLLSCFVGHPVLYIYPTIYYRPVFYIQTPLCDSLCFAPLQHLFATVCVLLHYNTSLRQFVFCSITTHLCDSLCFTPLQHNFATVCVLLHYNTILRQFVFCSITTQF